FPLSELARDDTKQRMWLGCGDAAKLAVQLWGPCPQFGHQMSPLIKQLPIGFWKLRPESASRNLTGVETVSTTVGLLRDSSKESGNDGQRIIFSLKASKLWMMTVAARRAR